MEKAGNRGLKIGHLFGHDAIVINRQEIDQEITGCVSTLVDSMENKGINRYFVENMQANDIPTPEALFKFEFFSPVLTEVQKEKASTNPFALRTDVTDLDLLAVATLLGGPFADSIRVKRRTQIQAGLVGRQRKPVIDFESKNKFEIVDPIAKEIITTLIYQARIYRLHDGPSVGKDTKDHIQKMAAKDLVLLRKRRLLIAGSQLGSVEAYNKYIDHLRQYQQ